LHVRYRDSWNVTSEWVLNLVANTHPSICVYMIIPDGILA
jgi:hypothetical protein